MKLIDLVYKMINAPSEIQHIQLVGQGGSSKTYQMLDAYTKLSDYDEYIIPLYIPLTETIIRTGYSIFRFIERHYLDVETEYDVDLMTKRILDMFGNEQYKFVLLLDAYNEVVNNFEFRTDNHGINLEIQELNKLPNVKIIVSTRYELTGVTFGDYLIAEMDPLTQEQIDYFLPNRTSHEEQLVGLLRLPFYMNLYLKLRKEKDIDTSIEPITTEGELLNYYYLTYLPKKFSSENRLDRENQHLEQLLFCLQGLLPKISYFMHQNNTSHITENQIDACFKAIENLHAKSWNVMALIRSIVPTGIMYKADNADDEISYAFSHEHIKDFFFCIFWIEQTSKEAIHTDMLNLHLSHSEMCYIGDILGEYRYSIKKDDTETSPIEKRISKYRGIYNDSNVQNFISSCIEMMKKKRYHISADYSNLDLSLCDFSNADCSNSNFSGSYIKSSTFIVSTPIPISLPGIRLWSDGSILINFYEDGSFVAYNLQNGKEMYRNIRSIKKTYSGFEMSVSCNTSYISINSDFFYICFYDTIYKYSTYTGELIDYRICIYNGKNTGLSLFEKAINKIYQKHCDHKSIKYYTLSKPYFHSSDVCIVFDSFNSVFCYVYNGKDLIFFNKSFEKIGEFSLEKYGTLFDYWDSPNSFTQFGWYIIESESGDVLFFLKLSIKKDSIEVIKKYELELNKNFKPGSKDEDLEKKEGKTEIIEFSSDEEKMAFEEMIALDGETKTEKNNSGYVRRHFNEKIECVKVIDEKHAVVLCTHYLGLKNHSLWYYIDLFNKEYSSVESEKWFRYCDSGTIGFLNNGTLNNIACFFHSKSNRNISLLNYSSGKQGDINLKPFFGDQEDKYIVGCFNFGIIIESNNKICVFDKEFRWQKTLSKNSSAIIEFMFFEEDTLNCCINKSKSMNGIDEKHFRNLYCYNINDKSVEITSLGFEDFYLVQHGFYTFLLSKVVYINKHNGILVLECTYRHHMYAVIKFTDHADEKRVNHIMNIVGFNCDVYPKSNVIIQNNPATMIDIFTPDEIYNQALADYDNKDNEGKGVISESFNIIDDHLLFCKSETSCTKMYRVDIENANMQIVATLREGGNYGSCEISDQYVFCSMWEQLDSSYYRNKSSVLIDIYSTEGSFIESIDINEVIHHDSTELTSIEEIQSISFSDENNTISVLDNSNRIFLFSLRCNMGHIYLSLINMIQILPSVNITGCDFTDIKILDDDKNGNTLKTLLDNGGVIT